MNSTASQQPTIIGIAGASGAGKSLFARQLFSRLRKSRSEQDVAILHEDNYYRAQDDLPFSAREKTNYDHPDAFEHSLLAEHLSELRAGNSIQIPQYDYSQHTRKTETRNFEPSRILIIEGILVLHDSKIRAQQDLKIFVDVPLDICLIRRIERDTQERGRSLESVLNQYQKTVRPMYHQFIEPTKKFADMIVPRGGENFHALDVLYNHLDKLLAKTT